MVVAVALRRIDGRDTAYITTDGTGGTGWAAWTDIPPWANVKHPGLNLPKGRYRLEPLAGRIVAYDGQTSLGSVMELRVVTGTITLYGYQNAAMIVTRMA